MRDSPPGGEAVLHLGGHLGVLLPMDQTVGLQLLQGGAEGLEGDAADVSFHLIEAHHPKFGQGVENGHLVLAADERQGIGKAGLLQIFRRDAP